MMKRREFLRDTALVAGGIAIGPGLLLQHASLHEAGLLPPVEPGRLCFETEDTGRGWLRGHHDHLHVSGARAPFTR